MKRRVALLVLILMFSVGMAITVSAAGESADAKWWEEIDWGDLMQNKVVPAAVTGITLIGSVYVAWITTVNKIKAASTRFEKAADDVEAANKVSKDAKTVADKAVVDAERFRREQDGRLARLEQRQADELCRMREEMKEVSGNVEKLREMMAVGFGNLDELVAKGSAREIMKISEDGNGKENA